MSSTSEHGSDMVTKTQEFVHMAVKGNRDAMVLLDQLYFVAHLWDDLIDNDRRRSQEEINRAFVITLVELPRNPFYARHFHHLNGVLVESISAWMLANDMEQRMLVEDDDTAAAQAYTLRTLYNSMTTACAFCVGGFEWSQGVARMMKQDEAFLDGSFDEYAKTFRKESDHG